MLPSTWLGNNTPGVYFEWLDRNARSIDLLRTDIAGIVGVAARGPLHTPIKVDSWVQFTSIFGQHIAEGYLAYAVEGFFRNGGQTCWVVRVADPNAIAHASIQWMDTMGHPVLDLQASTPGSWANQLTVTVLPFVPGRFSLALRRQRGAQETWHNLSLEPPSVELNDSDQKPAVRLVAAYPKAWEHKLSVTVKPSSLQPGRFSLSLHTAGTWRDLRKEPAASGKRLFHRENLSMDPEDSSYLIKVLEGAVEPKYLLATDLRDLAALERLPPQSKSGLSETSVVFDAEPRFVGAVLNDPHAGSRLVKVTGLGNWAGESLPNLRRDSQKMQGGADGLDSLKLEHLIGRDQRDEIYGLQALEAVEEISILLMPDLHFRQQSPNRQKPRPPRCDLPAPEFPVIHEDETTNDDIRPHAFEEKEIIMGQQALIQQCELLRDRVAILDPPRDGMSPDEILAYRKNNGFDTRYAALYFPWIHVQVAANKGQEASSELVRAIPPSGHIAGIYAGTDLRFGVHHPPANRVVEGAAEPTSVINDLSHGTLNTAAINVIRSIPGRDTRVLGARTLSSLSEWRYVNVRRLMIMIEESIEQAMQWIVMENNNADLWREVDRVVRSFLDRLWKRGMLDGSIPEEAYRVTCDESTNPPESVALGKLVTEIGVQPPLPAEFVVVRIGRTQGRTDIDEGPKV